MLEHFFKIRIHFLDDYEIIINYNTEQINSRWENIYVDLLSLEKNTFQKINGIKLNLINKFQILDEDIIFKRGNCIYIK